MTGRMAISEHGKQLVETLDRSQADFGSPTHVLQKQALLDYIERLEEALREEEAVEARHKEITDALNADITRLRAELAEANKSAKHSENGKIIAETYGQDYMEKWRAMNAVVEGYSPDVVRAALNTYREHAKAPV